MVSENPTPEEELLKLVDSPPSGQPAPEVAKPPTQKQKKSFLGPLTGLFSFGAPKKTKKSENKDKKKSVVNIKWWSNLLLALVVAAVIYLLLSLFVFKFDESQFLAHVGITKAVYPILEEGQGGAGQTLEYYMKPLKHRNPFISPSVASLVDEQQEALIALKPQTSQMAMLLGGMKLVGISWTQQNQEPLAMIEDVKTGRTYFARKGQIVQGVKVQSITQEKVIVTYEGEEGFLL